MTTITLTAYTLEAIIIRKIREPLMDKHARLEIFCERLQAAPPAQTREEAYALLCRILDAVEDEFSGVLNNPPSWQTDGRLYRRRRIVSTQSPVFPTCYATAAPSMTPILRTTAPSK
jgi:hypothetical protein